MPPKKNGGKVGKKEGGWTHSFKKGKKKKKKKKKKRKREKKKK